MLELDKKSHKASDENEISPEVLFETLSELAKLYENKYVSFTDLEEFKKSRHLPNLKTIKKQKQNSIIRFNFKTYKKLKQLENYLIRREKLNKKFIKSAKEKTFKIENSKLDKHQIAAVVASEDAELILAPAGSGKTATLLAKVDYLINQDKIAPKNILVIAFTNKVVAELKDRLKNNNVEIRTFHSFGNKIIRKNFQNYRLLAEDTSEKLIQKILTGLKNSDEKYRENYEKFLSGDYLGYLFIKAKTLNPEAFEELIISAISLQKSERLNLKQLNSRLERIPDESRKTEAKKLFELYAPIYESYENYLKKNHFYDFSDMLNLSTDYICQLPNNSFDYEYILVDEAQDLSKSKSELLKATLEKCKRVKLFAVGDDWQSIYRFAGSNLKVLDDFEKIFGLKTYRGIIEYTYRFGEPTAKISNRFVTKNPYQSKKRVTPAIKKYTPIEFELYEEPPKNSKKSRNSKIPPDYLAVNKKLEELYQKYGRELETKNIQIISRFNRDIFRLINQETNQYKNAKYDPKTATLTWKVSHQTILEIPYCTIHKAKGITRDIVFVINANDGGIPATRDGNPMLEVMLAELDNYSFAEERRLFYVALTRAKEKTIVIANKNNLSPFVLEIVPKLKEEK